jgi:tRNA threonylcarbamoyladenosine biosynthesis protein TsaB
MKILSIDTANGACGVALLIDGKIATSVFDNENGKQAERLLPIIMDVLAKGGIGYKDLSAVAVNIGPGSFTGVRIGIAAAKGLNLVHKTPLIAVTSLEVEAACVDTEKNILVVLDANRGQVFCQMLNSAKKTLSDAVMLDYADIGSAIIEDDFVLAGSGSSLVADILAKDYKFTIAPSRTKSAAEIIAHIAADKFANNEGSDSIHPLYIRPPDAKVKGGVSASSSINYFG